MLIAENKKWSTVELSILQQGKDVMTDLIFFFFPILYLDIVQFILNDSVVFVKLPPPVASV